MAQAGCLVRRHDLRRRATLLSGSRIPRPRSLGAPRERLSVQSIIAVSSSSPRHHSALSGVRVARAGVCAERACSMGVHACSDVRHAVHLRVLRAHLHETQVRSAGRAPRPLRPRAQVSHPSFVGASCQVCTDCERYPVVRKEHMIVSRPGTAARHPTEGATAHFLGRCAKACGPLVLSRQHHHASASWCRVKPRQLSGSTDDCGKRSSTGRHAQLQVVRTSTRATVAFRADQQRLRRCRHPFGATSLPARSSFLAGTSCGTT